MLIGDISQTLKICGRASVSDLSQGLSVDPDVVKNLLGRMAARAILDRLAGNEGPSAMDVEFELVQRGST